jgi:hypothetical protein
LVNQPQATLGTARQATRQKPGGTPQASYILAGRQGCKMLALGTPRVIGMAHTDSCGRKSSWELSVRGKCTGGTYTSWPGTQSQEPVCAGLPRDHAGDAALVAHTPAPHHGHSPSTLCSMTEESRLQRACGGRMQLSEVWVACCMNAAPGVLCGRRPTRAAAGCVQTTCAHMTGRVCVVGVQMPRAGAQSVLGALQLPPTTLMERPAVQLASPSLGWWVT